MTDELSENIKKPYINHIIDEMITIEGGFKSGETFLFCSPIAHINSKRIIAIESNCSSGIIWTATQKSKEEIEKE